MTSIYDQDDLIRSCGLGDLYDLLIKDDKIVDTISCLLDSFERHFPKKPNPEKYKFFLRRVILSIIEQSYNDWTAFKKQNDVEQVNGTYVLLFDRLYEFAKPKLRAKGWSL